MDDPGLSAAFGEAVDGVFDELGIAGGWVRLDRYLYATGDAITVSVGRGPSGVPAHAWSFTPASWSAPFGSLGDMFAEVVDVVWALACRMHRPRFRIGRRDPQRLARVRSTSLGRAASSGA